MLPTMFHPKNFVIYYQNTEREFFMFEYLKNTKKNAKRENMRWKKLKWLQLLNNPYSFLVTARTMFMCIFSIRMQVSWYQNSFMLEPTDRRTMFSRGNKYILSIVNFRTTDFGNYRFVLFYCCTNMFTYKHLLKMHLLSWASYYKCI